MSRLALWKAAVDRSGLIKKLQPWFFRGLGLLLLVYLLSRVSLAELLAIWAGLSRMHLSIAILLAVGMMLVKVQRWRLLLKGQSIPYSFKDAVMAYFIAYYFGIVTPGRAGEFLKVVYLRKTTQASYGAGMVSVLLDRLLDIAVLISLAALGVVLVPQFAMFDSLWVWITGLALAAGVFFIFLKTGVLQRLWRWMVQSGVRAVGLEAGGGQVEDFLSGLNLLLKPKVMLPAAVFTLASWAFLLLSCYFILLALSLDIPFWFMAFAMAIAGLLSLLPVSIAGIGVRDTALVGIFGLIGVAAPSSLAYSLLYFAVFGFVLGVIGAYFWHRYPIHGY
jgi:glycosyltransferase 2 family protein